MIAHRCPFRLGRSSFDSCPATSGGCLVWGDSPTRQTVSTNQEPQPRLLQRAEEVFSMGFGEIA